MRYFKLIFLTAFFLYFIMPSYSEPVYIWEQDDGTTVFSFLPPPDNITPKGYIWGSAYPNPDVHSKKYQVTSREKEIARKFARSLKPIKYQHSKRPKKIKLNYPSEISNSGKISKRPPSTGNSEKNELNYQNMPSAIFNKIKAKITSRYPDDFTTQKVLIQSQVKSYLALQD